MGPRGFAGRAGRTGWKVWRCPALHGLGDWRCYVEQAGCVVQRFTRSGLCIGTRYVAFTASDAASQVDQVTDTAEEMMKRRGSLSTGAAVTPHADLTELLERWPTLAGWLSDPTFDDGTLRQSGWFGVSCRDGLITALLKDGGEGICIQLSAPSPLRLLDLMEHSLLSPDAPWRHDPKAQGVKVKKK